MTSCANALKQWEEKNGSTAAEASTIRLYCQMPPISKLDNSLNNLSRCEHLAVSTNAIDRLIPLGGMQNLRILSIGRNNLKRFEKLDENASTLREIWASYNQISSLDGLACLSNLEVLYLSNNNISRWDELDKLAPCTKLKDILLIGNPIYDDISTEDARIKVLKHMSANTNLVKIDNILIK
eukprot:CAMPEP_0203746180 /NCGR_PEP_ID=MMETSP0098-20131031/1699_1 /ASSEMBLY_ACC=CAM_ASM_000208 /TAXON_ID=96639 /ORGANISM=" , Strain NY0313808BC1" /LENGTH=181 /DNA_ID=CAMNT_0050634179 /DNA_START=287 /DNA_END=829 /DNA_ORIENTATION=-